MWVSRLMTVIAGGAFAAAAAAATPEELARDLEARNNDMLNALVELKQREVLTADAALALMREKVSPLLDFPKLTKRAMGKYWRRAGDEEKARITAAFQQLLENTYANVLTKYDDQKTEIVESKRQADGKILVTMTVRGKDKSARIDYLFAGDAPRVVDVKVEGISLVASYRRQFRQIIGKKGFDGLAVMLEEMGQR